MTATHSIPELRAPIRPRVHYLDARMIRRTPNLAFSHWLFNDWASDAITAEWETTPTWVLAESFAEWLEEHEAIELVDEEDSAAEPTEDDE